MRSAIDCSVICAIDDISAPVRRVSWLSRSPASASICWPTARTSWATTAKPRPCSPARALSISALRASIFIWLVICWIARVLSQAMRLTSAVSDSVSPEMSVVVSEGPPSRRTAADWFDGGMSNTFENGTGVFGFPTGITAG